MYASTEPRAGGACEADAGPVPPRCRGTVLWWDGPAPALARGASSGRSEDRFYVSGCDAFLREQGGVKLSAHEKEAYWLACGWKSGATYRRFTSGQSACASSESQPSRLISVAT